MYILSNIHIVDIVEYITILYTLLYVYITIYITYYILLYNHIASTTYVLNTQKRRQGSNTAQKSAKQAQQSETDSNTNR